MTKDNRILGSFLLENIPPAPAGQEKFDVSFEINTDGILVVTAAHRGSKNMGRIEVDARTSARLTDREINSMLDQAEKMKEQDEAEENRMRSLNRLEALCSKIKFKAQKEKPQEVGKVLKVSLDCISWIKSNPKVSQATFDSKFDELSKKAIKVFGNNDDLTLDLNKSNHVFEMSTATAKYYMDQGEAKTQEEDFEEAIVLFRKAYNIASRKGLVDKMVAASQRMGHVRRVLVEQGTDSKHNVDTCIDAAIRIAYAMETGERRKVLNKEQREELVDDIQFLSTEFFTEVSDLDSKEMHNALGWFMYAIDNSPFIRDISWGKVMLHCYISHINLSLAFIRENLAKEDFKSALVDINELTLSKEEALRLAKKEADRETLKTLVEELESCANLAQGLKLIQLSEETVKQGEDNSVERASVALDLLSEARKLTKQVDMKIFCKAKLYEGKLLLNLFINKEKAKSCFKEVMNISLSERYTNTLWYKEASTLFQQIKKAEEVPQTPSERRNTCLKELEPQIKELDAAKSLDDESFINFLFEKFPPKHHPNPKKPELGSQNSSALKKALGKLSGYYHPDKVDTSVHSEKHKVLCEEIAKRVNSRYARLKNED